MPDPLKCIIVDDDPISIKVLEEFVEKTELLSPIGSFTNASQVPSVLNEKEVDLIFLDVEMPEMTGLELIRSLVHKPEIIITSIEEKYALEAFDVDVIDYLLKPITDYARFLKAIAKVVEKREKNRPVYAGNIFVKVDSLLVNLDLNDILWVEAYGDYVKMVTQEKTYTVYTKLKSVEQKLPPRIFMKVHRSYIINLRKIDSISHAHLQVNEKKIPISASHKEKLINRLNLL